VLVNSMVRSGLDTKRWLQNGAGRWVHDRYGFGMLDAGLAVKTAQEFQGSVEEANVSCAVTPEQLLTSSADCPTTLCVVKTIQVRLQMFVHHVELILTMKHKYRGRLAVTLTSPCGTGNFNSFLL